MYNKHLLFPPLTYLQCVRHVLGVRRARLAVVVAYRSTFTNT
jgi:hypothetical protein